MTQSYLDLDHNLVTKIETVIEYNSEGLKNLGAELVFTQDRFGHYHSFFWQPTVTKLKCHHPINSQTIQTVLVPTASEAYYERIKRVLERRIPEQCHTLFQYQNQSLPFELVITPILPTQGEPELVLVIGHRLSEKEIALTTSSALPINPDPYQKLLTQIAQKIRRTLDLETIWQQTVDSLGQALQVSRCLLLDQGDEPYELIVKAEYCSPMFHSMLGMRLSAQAEPYLQQAMFCRFPFAVEQIVTDYFQTKSILVVSTFYQKERNGIICLQQCDRHRYWSQAEIELVQELADQVGTAIAHATIYQKLEKAILEAEEASRLKSEFLASTSHELRTPLNGILGFLKLILDGMADDEEEEREFLQQAYNSALHLLNLINDILDIAKIEAGKIEFNCDYISFNNICQEISKFASAEAQRKHLDFIITFPDSYNEIILYADYQRLLQVMLNLVGNALKFTHEGGVEVVAEVICKEVTRNNLTFPGIVKISVVDTGIGVALDKQEKLFDKFYQVDGSRTKAYGGTGLGLAISKKLVEAMGGKISFYSMGEGLGSTVTFTVPLCQLRGNSD